MVGLEVNCAKIIFDNLVKDHTSFLLYGALLSHVFRKFHIDLAFETSVIKVFEPFDRVVLHRMKLYDFPHPPPQPQHAPSPPPQSSTQVPSSPLNLLSLNPLPLNHLLHIKMLSTTLFLLK